MGDVRRHQAQRRRADGHGREVLIAFPTTADPGGRLSSDNTAVQLGELTAYSGPVDWALPAGGPGDEQVVRELALPGFARYVGLRVVGSTAFRLGVGADGRHYAVFPFSIELPVLFQPGPSPESARVTAQGAVRVDRDGPQFGGMKLVAKDVYVGRAVMARELCFSRVPAGGRAISPCETPSLDDEPYIGCGNDETVDRWDVSGRLQYPSPMTMQVAVFGGLAGGELSKLGGFVTDSEIKVQLAPGVAVNRVGAGVCLRPPPLKFRGDIGVEILDGAMQVNGRFLYTDPVGSRPWTAEVGGNVSLAGTRLGDGSATFNAWGDVDFKLSTAIDLAPVSLSGSAAGWIEPRSDRFNVTGTMTGCIVSVLCAQASGLVSSTGVAGCIDAGELVFYEPVNPRTGSFGAGSISFSTRRVVVPLKAGFGFRYGGTVDLLGNSCDFTPYSATRARAAQASGPLSQDIAPGTEAVSLRVRGTNGPPKIVVRGPRGVTITSPADRPGARRKGRWLLAENPDDGTTNVLLVKPAAGRWTIAAAPGSASTPTRVERAAVQAPPLFAGQTRKLRDGRREVAVAYAVPDGSRVELVERAKGVSQIIASRLRGKRCRGARRQLNGQPLRCATVRFRPSRGPGGRREVQAVVTRGGVPLSRERVVAFRAARETLPASPGALRLRRVGRDVIAAFGVVRGASRYTATAVVGDGRRLGFDLGGTCRAVRIPLVSPSTEIAVKVAGVRYDLQTGRYRSARLAPRRTKVGPGGRLPRRSCT